MAGLILLVVVVLIIVRRYSTRQSVHGLRDGKDKKRYVDSEKVAALRKYYETESSTLSAKIAKKDWKEVGKLTGAGYALDAVDFFRQNLDINLDLSRESIKHVQGVIDTLNKEMTDAQPEEAQVEAYAKLLSSYIGQVLVEEGWEWVSGTENATSVDSVEKTGVVFFVRNKVSKNIVNGSEDKVIDAINAFTEMESQRTKDVLRKPSK